MRHSPQTSLLMEFVTTHSRWKAKRTVKPTLQRQAANPRMLSYLFRNGGVSTSQSATLLRYSERKASLFSQLISTEVRSLIAERQPDI